MSRKVIPVRKKPLDIHPNQYGAFCSEHYTCLHSWEIAGTRFVINSPLEERSEGIDFR
jgi:hypothetical protein